ncbi:MAG: hypothetical protein JXA18_07105 [Chitinispirillaceae bacterium]|nr:hypothetical protein [Chitinispirillaceae bacterium]
MLSRGTYQDRTKSIEALYRMTIAGAGGAAFDNGICAGGKITWTGSGSVAA